MMIAAPSQVLPEDPVPYVVSYRRTIRRTARHRTDVRPAYARRTPDVRSDVRPTHARRTDIVRQRTETVPVPHMAAPVINPGAQ